MSKNPKKIILVVDDDYLILSLVSSILRPLGYEVATAASGEAALDTVVAGPPSLVLLDIAMPHPDGYAVAHELRARFGDTLPIVALTGRPDKDPEKARRAGFTGWIEKPFDVAELARTVMEQTIEVTSRHTAADTIRLGL